jgi:hypothetical protein
MLNQVSQAVPHSMGFRTAQPALMKSKMLLVASVAEVDVGGLVENLDGADAVLLRLPQFNPGVKVLQKASLAAPDTLWGWRLGDSREEVRQLIKVGVDFVVFSAANTRLAMLHNDQVGKILEVAVSLDEGLLRVVDELPVDAVLITGEENGGHFLTWHHLLLFQRFSSMLSKPLLVSAPSIVSADELQALWRVGVTGVVINVALGQPFGKLCKLHQEIDKLTFPPRLRRGRMEALLPGKLDGEVSTVTEVKEKEDYFR